jgi:hypothetical protein
MFGNLQGWIISLAIAVAGGYVLWLGSRVPAVSEPSGVFPNLLAKVALPIDAKSLAAAPMTGDCDAGDKYRAAINEFLADGQQYETWHAKANVALKDKPHAVELLVEASGCARMALFRKSPSEVVNYAPELPALDTVEKLGQMAVQRGMLLRKERPDEARRYLAAAYALGYHLFEERIVWREFVAGINLMSDAAKYLSELEQDPGRARVLERFADDALKYKADQLKLYEKLATADSQAIGRFGGDAYALARQSPETMWRTTAILAVGRMRYNTPRRGDQLAAPRELKAWAADPDPAVRAAANTALNLSLEQYRMLR